MENQKIEDMNLAELRHDLYGPLNIIKGFCELIIEDLEVESSPLKIIDPLKDICDWTNTLKFLISSSLNQEVLEQSFGTLNSDLRETINWNPLEDYIDRIHQTCHRLLEASSDFPEVTNDLNKIYISTNSFKKLVSECKTSLKVAILTEQVSPASTPLIQDKIQSHSANALKVSAIDIKNEPLKVESNIKQKKYNVLVVDDNEYNCQLLSHHLEKQGYFVTTTTNGDSAKKLINDYIYDLVLLDIIMPVMDGYQVLSWLREKQFKNIPVIVISSIDDVSSIARCIEMGAEDYLHKPFNPIFLKARIEATLEKKRLRDQEVLFLEKIAFSNQKIMSLNAKLKEENNRLSSELEIAQELQKMVLPKQEEFDSIEDLEISAYMRPADEVGGDYYDVIQHHGHTIIGIGDVMGHGLKSGVLMLMLQTAVQTLVDRDGNISVNFLEGLNKVLCRNMQRMNVYKTLTLSLLDYHQGKLSITGQHEEIIIVRASGQVEIIDTIDLGIPLGLEEHISGYVNYHELELFKGDLVVLFTDGVTEAVNKIGEPYGMERLCQSAVKNLSLPISKIKESIILDVQSHADNVDFHDDITLLLLKKK